MKKPMCAAVAVALSILATAAIAATPTGKSSKKAAAPMDRPNIVDMPKGSSHSLRSKVPIRGAVAKYWRTHAPVQLTDHHESEAACAWKDHKPPSLDGAHLFVEDDSTGKWLYLMFADGSYVRRSWTFGTGSAGESNWIAAESADDWNYYVMFQDNQGPASNSIYKQYRVEIFPPVDQASDDCNKNDRPTNAIKLTSSTEGGKPRACETGSGDGWEPKH